MDEGFCIKAGGNTVEICINRALRVEYVGKLAGCLFLKIPDQVCITGTEYRVLRSFDAVLPVGDDFFVNYCDVRNVDGRADRKSTRLNSSHRCISYAVFCL